jgi:ferredoxin
MCKADDGMSRRRFLDKTAKAGMTVYSLGVWSPIFAAPLPGAQPSPQAARMGPHRYIDKSKCIGCGRCVLLCPMEAITVANNKSAIDPNECAECGTCSRAKVCPVDAITPVELEWPRLVREMFSNPLVVKKSTGVGGRGTEETKTNDSTNRYKRGEVGVLVEPGRPVLGSRFHDVEKILKKFRARGYEIVSQNPVVDLIGDPKTGALNPEILDEKIISCVIEFIVPETAAHEVMVLVRELSMEVESIFSVSIALRAGMQGESRFEELLGTGVYHLPNGKVNIGAAENIAKGEA